MASFEVENPAVEFVKLENGNFKCKVVGNGPFQKARFLEGEYKFAYPIRTHSTSIFGKKKIIACILQNAKTGKFNLYKKGNTQFTNEGEADAVFEFEGKYLFANLDESGKKISYKLPLLWESSQDESKTFSHGLKALDFNYASKLQVNKNDTPAILDSEGHIIEGKDRIKTVLDINKEPAKFLKLNTNEFRDSDYISACTTAVKNAIKKDVYGKENIPKEYVEYVEELKENIKSHTEKSLLEIKKEDEIARQRNETRTQKVGEIDKILGDF